MAGPNLAHHRASVDDDRQTVRAVDIERYDALTLIERPAAADPQERTRLMATAWRDRGPDAESTQLLRRAKVAGLELDLTSLSERAAASARRLDDIDLSSALTWEESPPPRDGSARRSCRCRAAGRCGSPTATMGR